MARNDKTRAFTEMMQQAPGMMPVTPALAPQMEQFWKAQDSLLDESEAFVKGWYKRRHEAAESALDAARKMNGSGSDPAAVMRAMADWQRRSIERMTEDVQQWVEMCSRCAGRVASAETKAAEEGLEETGARAKSAADTKKVSPV